jgi:hypothetical protein
MSWGEIGTLASILGAFIGASAVVQAWLGNRTVKAMHAETQATLKVLGAGQKSLGEAVNGIGEAVHGIGQGQTTLGQILERMDRAAEDRYRDLKDRLGGGAEV